MPDFNRAVLTKKGAALIAKSQAGLTTIQFTRFATGNGGYGTSEDLASRTSLKTEKQSFGISTKTIVNNETLVLKIIVSNINLVEGYYIKEVGLFATDPDEGEILYSIATAVTDKWDYLPAYNDLSPSTITLEYRTTTSNASSVTIQGGTGALVHQDDFNALESRVVVLENSKVKKYGARKLVSASSPIWERLGDAVGLVANAAVGNDPVLNDFMTDVYPYNKAIPCNITGDLKVNAYLGDADFKWDGTNGQVMLELPLFFSDRYIENGYEYRWLSAAPIDGLKVDPLFLDGDTVREKVYIPIFNGISEGGKLISKSGVIPTNTQTRTQFRTLAKANGTRWQLEDVWGVFALEHLFIIMFANSNGQAVLGQGRASMPYNAAHVAMAAGIGTNKITIATEYASQYALGNIIYIGTTLGGGQVAKDREITNIAVSESVSGGTDIYFDGAAVDIAIGNIINCVVQRTGATVNMASANGRAAGVDGRTAVRFLYIEDFFANGWRAIDGDNINTGQHFLCLDRNSYADATYAGKYFSIGYVCPLENGYVKELGLDKQYPMAALPVAVGGATNTYYCDHYYYADGERVPWFGGTVDDGSICGPFSWLCINALSDTTWNRVARPLAK